MLRRNIVFSTLKMTRTEFQKIFKEQYPSLCNYALKIVRDRDAAEDVVQEVMVDFWNKNEAETIIDAPENYLVRSVKFKSIDYLRKITREQSKQDEVKEDILFNLSDSSESDLMEKRKQALYATIAKLPAKTKQVFMMAKMEGMTYGEIAEQMDISPKTVENQMGRALRILREELKDLKLFELIMIFTSLTVGGM